MKLPLKLIATTLLASAAFAATPAAIAGNHNKAKATKAVSADIVDTAVSAGAFNTLVAAVQAADLVATLKSDGPFTVFAPTDEAFAKLPAGTVENLLKPENKQQLIAVLTYHVVPGKVASGDLAGKRDGEGKKRRPGEEARAENRESRGKKPSEAKTRGNKGEKDGVGRRKNKKKQR